MDFKAEQKFSLERSLVVWSCMPNISWILPGRIWEAHLSGRTSVTFFFFLISSSFFVSLGRTWISWISWRERQPWKTGEVSFIRMTFYENICLKCDAICNARDLFSNTLQYLVRIATHSLLWWLLLQIYVAPLT